MKILKKILSSLLICAFALSLASCGDADPEEVKPVIETYAKCIQYMDAARILDNTEPVDDATATAFAEKLTFSDKDYEQAKVKDAIAKSIAYTVNDMTLTTQGNTATCEVMFARSNYEVAFHEFVGYSDAYLQALSSISDKKTFNITFTFNKNKEGRWLATADSLDKLNELFLIYGLPIIRKRTSIMSFPRIIRCFIRASLSPRKISISELSSIKNLALPPTAQASSIRASTTLRSSEKTVCRLLMRLSL